MLWLTAQRSNHADQPIRYFSTSVYWRFEMPILRREDGLTSTELEELRRLRRENRQLREEREILKNGTRRRLLGRMETWRAA